MTRKEVFEKRAMIGAALQLTANCIQNPPEDLNWQEVEAMRKNIEDTRQLVMGYLNEVEGILTDESTNWKEQWDLAFKLHEPYHESYDPTLIDVEALTAEFIGKGLNEVLAEQIATAISKPEEAGL